jgi:hypothetical protein
VKPIHSARVNLAIVGAHAGGTPVAEGGDKFESKVGMQKTSLMIRLAMSVALVGAVGSSTVSAWAEESSAPSPVAETKSDPKEREGAEAERVDRHGSLFVDPLGFALFGPRLGVEAGAGHVSGAVSARWFNAGLLAHSLFAKGSDELAFGYSLGLRGRYYLPEGLEGVHLGVAAEYLHSRVENPPLLIATSSSYLVPYGEVGYRLASGRVYADASAGVGYALRLSSRVDNLPGGASAGAYTASDESSIYGTASLDLGVFF